MEERKEKEEREKEKEKEKETVTGITREEFEEAIRSAVEKARREEKEKVYPVIDELKKRLSVLEKEREEAVKRAEEEERAKLSVEERLGLEIQDIRKEFEGRLKKAEEERRHLEENLRQAELRAFKERRLREEGVTELAELIDGSTEEEIEEKIKVAKQKLDVIREQVAQKVSEEVKAKVSATQTPPPTAPAKVPEAMTGLTIEQIRELKPEEFEKLWPQIEKMAESEFIKSRERESSGGTPEVEETK